MPIGLDSYDPCLAIRNFKTSLSLKLLDTFLTEEEQKIELAFRNFSNSITGMVGIPKGSESMITDPFLLNLMNEFCALMKSKLSRKPCTVRVNKASWLDSKLVKSSNPEYRTEIVYDSRIPPLVLLGSEAKGFEHGFNEAIYQAFQVCADAALRYLNLRVSRENFFVPGVVCFSGMTQFISVYFAPNSFPCLSLLTRPLNTCHFSDRKEIAVVLSCLSTFLAKNVTDNLKNILIEKVPPLMDTLESVELASSDILFFKPVRGGVTDIGVDFTSNALCNLDYVMSAYKALDVISNSHTYILFPVGILTLNDPIVRTSSKIVKLITDRIKSDFPDEIFPIGSPVILFDRLNENWRNTKPPEHLHKNYLIKVLEATRIFIKANVAHLDLRPSNIMWRQVGEYDGIEISIIDLESFCFFEQLLPLSYVSVVSKDPRYPFIEDDLLEYDNYHVTSEIYDWWYESIKLWLLSHFESHMEFMNACTSKKVISKVYMAVL